VRAAPTAIRSDVLVLGSTLGSLVAASVLARARLRVLVLEEEAQTKRPPLLREPFALTGLGTGEPIDLFLRELTVPLLERREIKRERVALQVVLPKARIDIGGGRSRVSADMEAYGLCDSRAAGAWLDEADAAGDEERARLLEAELPAASVGLSGRLRALRSPPPPLDLPPPPGELGALIRAQLQAVSGVRSPRLDASAALLLRTLRDRGFGMPDAGRRFHDVFRRRLLSRHGEIRPVGEFGLSSDGQEVSAHVGRHRLFARACVVGAPRELLRRFVDETRPAPRWLRGLEAPDELPVCLLRAERRALPVGMASRLVSAEGSGPEDAYWLTRSPDPEDAEIDWVVLRGPGAIGRSWQLPLISIAPFSEGRIVPVDPGPEPRWDRDGAELRFPSPRQPIWLKRRPPIVAVGPEVAPDLGFEGEILFAHQVACRLIDRLGGARHRL
jgi:hypothetical protein